MLAAGLAQCRRLGLAEVLLTCDPGNEPSRKVILANGGEPGGRPAGEDRFWIRLADGGRAGPAEPGQAPAPEHAPDPDQDPDPAGI
jgi:hypothetical protein